MHLCFLLLTLMVLAVPAAAQSVRVSSGEHGEFTRLVLTIPPMADWQFGRTEDGYAFRLRGTAAQYDIDTVFNRIGRNRLAALRENSADGSLRLGLACACHAMPFEFRPGVVVIDLHDGQPPVGSTFEALLDGQSVGGATVEAPPRPRARPGPMAQYDWVATALGRPGFDTGAGPKAQLPGPPDPSLALMKQQLVEGFARAASEGLIEPVPSLPAAKDTDTRSGSEAPPIRIGDPLDTRSGLSPSVTLSAEGNSCPSPESLALEAWGDSRPPAVQFAEHVAGLVGEFDVPSNDAVAKAVRFHLHLGFGAEARAILQAFPTDHPDQPLWISLGRILDGDSDELGAFRGLAACDGPAALWAALADPAVSPAEVNRDAMVRSFSALPAHLRRLVGPPLVERFLAAGDKSTAIALNTSLQRVPGKPDARQQITAARIAGSFGADPMAKEMLSEVLADPGPAQTEALVALVEMHVKERRPIDPAVADSLSAFLAQSDGNGGDPELARAHVLALALSDRFEEAFSALPEAPSARSDIWSLLSDGPDAAVLQHAIGADVSQQTPEVRSALAERLLTLGFVEEAQRWSTVPLPLPRRDRTATQQSIAARAWSDLGTDAPDHWRNLAEKLIKAEPVPDAPLAQGRSLAAMSVETRMAIDALLSALPDP